MSEPLGLAAFTYPGGSHQRRHGPNGYTTYQSFKPWLRDEFSFRCVYCLVRERWYPNGHDAFGVDHLIPQSVRPDLICDYGNLLYLCNRCNSAKRACGAIDPCVVVLREHLQINGDGTLTAKSKEGWLIINTFNLDYSSVVDYRRRKIERLNRIEEQGDAWAIHEELAYPEDLPDLSERRCKNTRPDGIERSYYALKAKGELEPTY